MVVWSHALTGHDGPLIEASPISAMIMNLNARIRLVESFENTYSDLYSMDDSPFITVYIK